MGRRTLVLLVALLLAAVASFAMWQFLTGVEDEVREGQTLQPVYRAGAFIAEGTRGDLLLSQENRLVASEEALDFMPENAISTPEELEAVLRGKLAAGPISANSVITRDQWVEISIEVTPLAELIPSGKQAITVAVDQRAGVNGFVRPGDRVNLIVTLDLDVKFVDFLATPGLGLETPTGEEGEGEQSIAKTITRFVLQGLPVLAVGREIRPPEDAPVEINVAPAEGEAAAEEAVDTGVLTLEVTPEQAERLVHAFEQGSMWLTLVPEDFVEVSTDGVTAENLFDDLGILGDLFDLQSR